MFGPRASHVFGGEDVTKVVANSNGDFFHGKSFVVNVEKEANGRLGNAVVAVHGF